MSRFTVMRERLLSPVGLHGVGFGVLAIAVLAIGIQVGLDWQIVPSLKVRANYATAFRIPNIPELFGGIAEGNLTTTDPCSGWSSLPTDSVVRQNCQAYGVPAGYVQPGNTILTTSGGNPDLEPEDAKSLTVGAVWIMSGICLVLLVLLSQYPRVFHDRLTGSLAFLPEHHKARVENTIASFLEGVESLRGLRSLLLVIAYSFLNWLLIAACYFCVIRSFHGLFEFGLIDEYGGGHAFQAIELMPGALPRNAGLVQYAPEFGTLV